MSTHLNAAKYADSMLTKIVAQRRLDVEAAQAQVSADELRATIVAALPAGDFEAVLRSAPMSVLAEMKRASPSKGDIAVGIDAAQQGLTYAVSGACTISVLTEPTWFKGSLDDMRRVREALQGAGLSPGTCVLRKDFIVDEYQLLEARAHGADTALLIVAILPEDRLAALMAACRALGMEPLVEVNTESEMEVALRAGAKVIGVNNRNLHTFEVDMDTTSRLAKMLPPAEGSGAARPLLIALSGVATRSDVQGFARDGACAVLVGESLMRALSPSALLGELLGTARPRALAKVCGLKTVEAAAAAAAAGADLLGLIFAPSKRQVGEDAAAEIVREVRRLRPRPDGWAPPRFSSAQAEAALTGDEAAAARWLELWRGLLARSVRTGGPLVVGVFVDASVDEMNRVAEAVGLDLVQLHGHEGWEVAAQLARPAVRVVHMEPGLTSAQVLGQLRGGANVAAVLLDSKGGGTGTTFDWAIGTEVHAKVPFILAGGLTPLNVGAANAQVAPWCVDVSSGVETDGTKDVAKIEAFVRNAQAVA